MATADRILQLKLVSDTTGVAKDMKKVEKSTNRIGTGFKKMGAIIGGAFAGLAVIDFLKSGVEDALAMETAMSRLGDTVRSMGGDWDVLDDRIGDVLDNAERLNFDDVGAAANLNTLIRQFGSVNKAVRILNVSMDVAAGLFGGDLDKAVGTVSKALRGNKKALIALGLPETTKPFQVIPRLIKKYGGAAEEELNTTQGKIDSFVTWIGQQGEAIGAELIKWIGPIGDFINNDLVPKFEEIKAALTPVLQEFQKFVEPVLRPFIELLKTDGNAAAAALIVIAAALGILLVPAAVLAIKVALVAVVITALIGAILLLLDKLPAIQKFFQDLVGTVTGKTDEMRTASTAFGDAFANPLVAAVNRVIKVVARENEVLDSMISALDEMKARVAAFSIPFLGKLFRLGGPSFPKFGEGGIVTRPTLALIGEKGPEAVVPLTGRGGMGITVNITAGVGDPVEIGRQVDRVLRAYRGRAGLAA